MGKDNNVRIFLKLKSVFMKKLLEKVTKKSTILLTTQSMNCIKGGGGSRPPKK